MSPPQPPVVVVVGSLHYDIMVDAPDRPRRGETVTGRAWRPKFGGKGGNQAVAAARAGAIVQFVGAIGADAAGAQLRGHLLDNGVGLDGVEELPVPSGGAVITDNVDLADRQGTSPLALAREYPATSAGKPVPDRGLALVAERRVAEVVRECGGGDDRAITGACLRQSGRVHGGERESARTPPSGVHRRVRPGSGGPAARRPG